MTAVLFTMLTPAMRLSTVLASASFVVLAACGGSAQPTDSTASASTSAAATATPAPTPTKGPVLDFTGGDPYGAIELDNLTDVDEMKGAPDDFKAYLKSVLAKSGVPDDDRCHFEIYVAKIDPAGFAQGSIGECGGAEIYWARVDGKWTDAIGNQMEAPPCADLKKFRFPVAVAGNKCQDESQDFKIVEYSGPM